MMDKRGKASRRVREGGQGKGRGGISEARVSIRKLGGGSGVRQGR